LSQVNEPQKGTKSTKPMNVWRIFCAAELPDQVRVRLQEHIQRLRKDVPDVAGSWSRVENIHLTLKFFGNVTLDQVQTISDAASRAVKEFSSFQIDIGKTGVFPRPSRPQVLWIGVSDPSGKLSALQQKFEDECAAEGFAKEDRAFRPHLTIARLRKPEGAQRLADAHLSVQFESIPVPLTELIVFRSELSSKGSKYNAISRHQLTNP
jgi:RNA 2',3'-cyclic 3'-phosphodiesterase